MGHHFHIIILPMCLSMNMYSIYVCTCVAFDQKNDFSGLRTLCEYVYMFLHRSMNCYGIMLCKIVQVLGNTKSASDTNAFSPQVPLTCFPFLLSMSDLSKSFLLFGPHIWSLSILCV